jgi:hypothetical protein
MKLWRLESMANHTPGFTASDEDPLEQSKPRFGREILAIVAGMLTGLISEVLASIVYSGFFMIPELLQASAERASVEAVQSRLLKDAVVISNSWLLVAITLLCYILAGYVAGRIANQNEIFIGIGACLAMWVFGYSCPALALRLPNAVVTPISVLVMALNIAACASGGYLASLQRAKKAMGAST